MAEKQQYITVVDENGNPVQIPASALSGAGVGTTGQAKKVEEAKKKGAFVPRLTKKEVESSDISSFRLPSAAEVAEFEGGEFAKSDAQRKTDEALRRQEKQRKEQAGKSSLSEQVEMSDEERAQLLNIEDDIKSIPGMDQNKVGDIMGILLKRKPRQIGYDVKDITNKIKDLNHLYKEFTDFASVTYDLSNDNVESLIATKPGVSREQLDFLRETGALQQQTPEFQQDKNAIVAQTAIGMIGDIISSSFGQAEALPTKPTGMQTTLSGIASDVASHQAAVKKINDKNLELSVKHRENILESIKEYDKAFNANEVAYMKAKNNLISDLLTKNLDVAKEQIGLKTEMADLATKITDHKLKVRRANQDAVNQWNTKVLNIHSSVASLNKAAREGRLSILGGEKTLEDSYKNAAYYDMSTQQTRIAANNIGNGDIDPIAFKSFPTLATRTADRAISAIYDNNELTKKQQGEAMQTYQLLLNRGVAVNPIDIINFLKKNKALKVSLPEFVERRGYVAAGLSISPEEKRQIDNVAIRNKLGDTRKVATTFGNSVNIRIPILLSQRFERGKLAGTEAVITEKAGVNVTEKRIKAEQEVE